VPLGTFKNAGSRGANEQRPHDPTEAERHLRNSLHITNKPHVMKTTSITRVTTLSAGFALIGLTSSLQGQQPATTNQFQSIEQVTPQAENSTLAKIVGKPVRNQNQEELSTLQDFLVDPQTGRVHFAVVDSGSNTSRIVPMRALQAGSGTEGLVVQRPRPEWDQVGTMSAEQLQGSVTIDDDHQQRLARQFALGSAEPAARDLIRASALKDRELRAADGQLGRIEDVVIDFANQIAAPMVALNAAGMSQKYLVPMQHLQINEGQGAITTTLSRNQFTASPPQAFAATGFNRGAYGPGNRPVAAAVSAVQQALARDASLAPGSVQVVPESRLILRGSVENEQKKAEAERAAQQAAPGIQIENQLTVRNQ
jgi:sporulation protein YlmC with PRC-barrel domain